MEACLFGAVYRSHEGNSPPNHKQMYEGEGTRKLLVHLSGMWRAMKEYRFVLMREAEEKGWPMVRNLWFEFEGDAKSWDLDDQVSKFPLSFYPSKINRTLLLILRSCSAMLSYTPQY